MVQMRLHCSQERRFVLLLHKTTHVFARGGCKFELLWRTCECMVHGAWEITCNSSEDQGYICQRHKGWHSEKCYRWMCCPEEVASSYCWLRRLRRCLPKRIAILKCYGVNTHVLSKGGGKCKKSVGQSGWQVQFAMVQMRTRCSR